MRLRAEHRQRVEGRERREVVVGEHELPGLDEGRAKVLEGLHAAPLEAVARTREVPLEEQRVVRRVLEEQRPQRDARRCDAAHAPASGSSTIWNQYVPSTRSVSARPSKVTGFATYEFAPRS